MPGELRRLAINLDALRASRDFRLLAIGQIVSGLGTQAALVAVPYAVDVASCLALVAAALAIGPQRPTEVVGEREPIVASIVAGLRFVRSNNALLGSFAIDLVAMTFGMPRALFAVLSLTVYHAGAGGTGLLYAAVAVGATAAALTTGWLERARRLGRIVLVAVIVWGGAIAGAGLVGTLWAAAGLLAVAGAVASLTSARTSVLSGGLACIVGAALVVLAFPALVAYDGGERPQHGAVAAVEAEGV